VAARGFSTNAKILPDGLEGNIIFMDLFIAALDEMCGCEVTCMWCLSLSSYS